MTDACSFSLECCTLVGVPGLSSSALGLRLEDVTLPPHLIKQHQRAGSEDGTFRADGVGRRVNGPERFFPLGWDAAVEVDGPRGIGRHIPGDWHGEPRRGSASGQFPQTSANPTLST